MLGMCEPEYLLLEYKPIKIALDLSHMYTHVYAQDDRFTI